MFKREMLAAGTLSGLKPALKLSEEVAAQGHEKLEICHGAEMTQLSEKLAAILVLALGSTMGPQQSIVVNREAGKEDDGISMWADLIRHFEKGSMDLRKMDLHKSWENIKMDMGEHPNVFYGKLVAVSSKLAKLRVCKSEEDLTIRLVSAIEREKSSIYANAIQQYRGALISGMGWSLTTLLEFLTHIHDVSKEAAKIEPEVLRGFVAQGTQCTYCKRAGHDKERCWVLHPHLKNEFDMKKRETRCYNCGEMGHFSRNCKTKRKQSNIIASLNKNKMMINCYPKTFIDSGSSVHTVTDLNLLEPETIRTEKEISPVDGNKIQLTHVGERKINTG